MKLVTTGGMRISGMRWLLSEEAVKSKDGRDLAAVATTRKAGVGDGSGRGESGGWFEILCLFVGSICANVTSTLGGLAFLGMSNVASMVRFDSRSGPRPTNASP